MSDPMFKQAIDTMAGLMHDGGWVMWPLLGLSLVAMTLIVERSWFWLVTNRLGRRSKFEQVGQLLRKGERTRATAIVDRDRSVYGLLLQRLLSEKPTDAAVTNAMESMRPVLERFMATLGTIITAAPMLGILGTVTGIIRAFHVLSATDTVTDPSKISAGIAEALLTTVAGLTIALIVLFPYNAFRAQMDRTLGLMNALIAAAQAELDEAGKTDEQARS
ncbi:MAG: MotA/TolQ/ExbB proton channel family protein [Planctomycetes bacterium]|nr:MotA/TolQ/ExbB proton channel family protein [Planctomycetota bacterium]